MANGAPEGLPDLRLDYDFRDRELLDRALTHRSAGAEVNFERLEFLGDRVLGLVIAELLLERFPDEKEGSIGRRFAQLVRAETLSRVGRACGVDSALTMAGSVANDNMVADATEAIIAALYLDGGLAAAAQFIKRHWTPLIGLRGAPPRDPKTALQEWSQGRGLGLPEYREIAREGPDHEPLFTVEAAVAGNPPVQARGTTKRIAEQEAATRLLTQLETADGE